VGDVFYDWFDDEWAPRPVSKTRPPAWQGFLRGQRSYLIIVFRRLGRRFSARQPGVRG
jgi:hypothetical protein